LEPEIEFTNMADEERVGDENTCSSLTNTETTDTPDSNVANKKLTDTHIASSTETINAMSTNISFKIPGLPSKVQPHTSVYVPLDVQLTTAETKSEGNSEKDLDNHKENKEQIKTVTGDTKEIKYSKLSPAEQLKQSQAPIPYKEPSWSGAPDDNYSFDVLKNGVIVETIKLEKPYYVFGRLPSCDITMDHPSLSRYHAVVQFCKVPKDGKEKGWYLYDLDSTHGTWINKNKTFPQKFYRVHVGHMLKFGGSTRLHILQV